MKSIPRKSRWSDYEVCSSREGIVTLKRQKAMGRDAAALPIYDEQKEDLLMLLGLESAKFEKFYDTLLERGVKQSLLSEIITQIEQELGDELVDTNNICSSHDHAAEDRTRDLDNVSIYSLGDCDHSIDDEIDLEDAGIGDTVEENSSKLCLDVMKQRLKFLFQGELDYVSIMKAASCVQQFLHNGDNITLYLKLLLKQNKTFKFVQNFLLTCSLIYSEISETIFAQEMENLIYFAVSEARFLVRNAEQSQWLENHLQEIQIHLGLGKFNFGSQQNFFCDQSQVYEQNYVGVHSNNLHSVWQNYAILCTAFTQICTSIYGQGVGKIVQANNDNFYAFSAVA